MPGVELALEKSGAVETKVLEASEKLSQVNLGREKEIEQRHLLAHELAEVIDQ